MINFVYETEQGVASGVALSIELINVPDYIIVTVVELPREPIESWYIENGKIKIDRAKLKQINRERMPKLTLIEFATVLDKHGMLDAVEEYMKNKAPTLTRIAYERATFISRTDPVLMEMAEVLGLSPDQVDLMWPVDKPVTIA